MNCRPPAALFIATALLFATPAHSQSFSWTVDTVEAGLAQPTVCAFGPDGRLYAGELRGRIHAYTLGPDHKPSAVQVINTINTDPNGTAWAMLGIAFNPLDPPDSVRIYIARSQIYQPLGVGAYLGKITRLTGPNFDKPVDIITGLPVSRMDHATNGILFGWDGNLYIQQGGDTNAGIPGPGLNGNRDEGPLSASTLIAYVNRPGFDGKITYDSPDPANANQTGGFDVEVFAPGIRNSYDIVMHSNGYLYATDNGPNTFFANGMMIRCDSIGPDITTADRIELVERGNYYGHPNRNRARFDPRQCFYHPPTDPPSPGYTPPLQVVTSSTDGIIEYRADDWGGALRGNLIAARLDAEVWREVLSADGRSIVSHSAPFPLSGCLDLTEGPDGTVYGVRYGAGLVAFMASNDPGPAFGPHIVMAFPQSGPVAGGRSLTLSGTRLGLTAPIAVRLGGVPATVTTWSPNSVTILTPPMSAPGPRDAYIQTAEGAETLTRAYFYIKANLTDGDRLPPAIDIAEPERRYYDQGPPSLTLNVHDRLGVDSVMVRLDSGAWQTLCPGTPDSSFATVYSLPAETYGPLATGAHKINLYARDDAHNLTLDSWTWYKGLPAGPSIRINCGGGGYSSSKGLYFSPDSGFTAGTPMSTNVAVTGTPDPSLYKDARVGNLLPPIFDYNLTMPSRVYTLRLYFAEIDTARACHGCRVFDVVADGDTVMANIDLSSVGAFNSVVKSAEAMVADGQLNLSFKPRNHEPLVSALEIYPLGLDDVTPPVIQDIPEPAGLTQNNPPRITLSASDPNDGELFGFYYQIDGGAWNPCVNHLKKKSYTGSWALPSPVFQALAVGMHTLRIRALDLAANAAVTAPWSFGRPSLVGVGPASVELAGALKVWPNPLRGGPLHVRFAQPRPGLADLKILDLAGRVVHHRALGWRPAGASDAVIDLRGSRLPAGLYLVRFVAPGVRRVERIALVR